MAIMKKNAPLDGLPYNYSPTLWDILKGDQHEEQGNFKHDPTSGKPHKRGW